MAPEHRAEREADDVLTEVMRRLRIGDELLWTPERLVPFEHWLGHIPFAFWLIKTLQPRRLAELGAHRGNSYCAFCQAITTLKLDTQAFAVDTWEGDLHMPHEDGLLDDLRRYHAPRYDRFSQLLQMTFDEARQHFAPGSLDLLHIDGTHTYDAVRQDFETWRDTLSSRGVVLFHDIAVHKADYGVWRFWAEIAREYPHFAFTHSYGLGVLGVGADLPQPLMDLFAMEQVPELATRVRAIFDVRGQGLVARLRLEQAEAEQRRLEDALRPTSDAEAALTVELDRTQQTLAQLRAEVAAAPIQAELAHLQQELQVAQTRAAQVSALIKDKENAVRNLQFETARLQRAGRRALHVGFSRATAGSAVVPAKVGSGNLVEMPSMTAVRATHPTGRIAVVVHLRDPETWGEIAENLHAIPERFDLFVSVTEGAGEQAKRDILAEYPNAQVVGFPNHGRDMLPFLTFAATGVLNRYDLVCKLRAKRTAHGKDGDAWREAALDGLLGSESRVRRIIAAFEADPDLGSVVGDGQILSIYQEHWVDNRAKTLEIGARMGLDALPGDIPFPGGSTYWVRPFLLRTLVGLKLAPEDFDPEPIGRSGTTAHAVERLLGVICADAGMRIQEASQLPTPVHSQSPAPVRVVAYYLPQYHPTPENDAWWGKGFTEWTNVTRAYPMFRHHRQPRLPADLGFYDLRLSATREAQAALARQYGVNGFCYYYYWFNGQRLLNTPLDAVLASGAPDFPFMICWANEPWSRNWDGGDREMLMPQDYTPGWARAFARDIAPLLKDPRYVRVDERPMVQIYRIMHIPERMEALREMRDELRQLGVGEVRISAGRVGFAGDEPLPDDAHLVGADSWFEFPPHLLQAKEITAQVADLDPTFNGMVRSYRSAINIALDSLNAPSRLHTHPTVMVGWDNTARNMEKSHAFHGATPALLRRWLRDLIRAETSRHGGGERVIFVNAWNEWAEGTYLEPDRDYGHGWLEAVASAVGLVSPTRPEALPQREEAKRGEETSAPIDQDLNILERR